MGRARLCLLFLAVAACRKSPAPSDAGGGGAAPGARSGAPVASSSTAPTPTVRHVSPADDGLSPADQASRSPRRAAIDGWYAALDAAVGAPRVATVEGRVDALVYARDGRVAVVNTSADTFEPPGAATRAKRAAELGRAVTDVLAGKKPTGAPVLRPEDVTVVAIDAASAAGAYRSMYRGVVHDEVALGRDAIRFYWQLEGSGAPMWVTASLERALAKASHDLGSTLRAKIDVAERDVEACVAKVASAPRVACGGSVDGSVPSMRLYALLRLKPVRPLVAQILPPLRGGDAAAPEEELVLHADSAPRASRDGRIPFSVAFGPEGVTKAP